MYRCAVSLGEHLRIIWRRRWRVLAIAFSVALLVYARGQSLHKQYASEVPMQVTASVSNAGDAAGQDATNFLAARYAKLATTDPVVEDAVRRSKLPLTLSEAQGRISAAADSAVGFIPVRVTGPSPDDAAALATAEAQALADTVARQEQGKVDDVIK